MNQPLKPLSTSLRLVLAILGIVAVVSIGLIAAGGWGVRYYNAAGPAPVETTVIIPKGTGFVQISQLLADADVIRYPHVFKVVAKVLGKTGQLKAGEYAFPPHASPHEVLSLMVDGKTVMHKFTVPEGLTTFQVMAMVAAEDKLEGSMPTNVGEGTLLPETYLFTRGDSRSSMVERMRRAMRNFLEEAWNARQAGLPFDTPADALTLASIVEKETGLDAEYGLVASVYINRIRLGMPLQADPTVIYAVTNGEENLGRRISRADLRSESPYNTYVHSGLPPTPIANPGRKAIEGVLNPPASDYIFFVANGKGGHNFSVTLDEHNRHVRAFRELLNR